MATDNTVNLTVDQGSSKTFTWNLLDQAGDPFALSGFDARLQVRRTYGDTSVLINCTLMNSKLSLSSNTVVLTLSPSDTSSIRFNAKDDDTLDCVYDLEIISPTGIVTKPARGSFTLNREVTR